MARSLIKAIATVLLTLPVSCSKETGPAWYSDPETVTLEVGFEEPGGTAGEPDTKTFVYDGSQVRWSSRAVDKVLYVFDTKGVKRSSSSDLTKS